MAVLRSLGFSITESPATSGAYWAVEAVHPDLGAAQVVALRNPPRLPRQLVEWSVDLTPQEREEALRGQATIGVRLEGGRADLLRDRKALLRILGALMGTDGVIAIDNTAQRFWSRAALDEELAHDADVDVEALYNLHAVSDEQGRLCWLHSHGFGEIGLFDFDLIHPDPSFAGLQSDAVRAMALAIAEGRLTQRGAPASIANGVKVHAVPAAIFDARAAPADRAARVMTEDHLERRAVICEPGGWLARLAGREPVPSRFFQHEPPDGALLNFSADAGALMAARARGSLPTFRRLLEEFEEFEFPALVKLGYPVDGGGPDALEHMWFKVHSVGADTVDATLAVRPIGISRMREGERASHDLSRLTDWLILTPAGNMTPRSTTAARRLRPHLPELRAAMQAARDDPGGAATAASTRH